MITVIIVSVWVMCVIGSLYMVGGIEKSRTYTIFGLWFGLLSSCFFSIGLLKVDKEKTKTFCGGNPKAEAALIMDRMNAVAGFVCLFLAFSLQILGVMQT